MATLFDRLNRELETFGRKAQAALDEGKSQIELLRLKRQQDRAARDLGRLTWRKERGGTVDAMEIDALLVRLDNLQAAIEKVERELSSVKAVVVSVEHEPASPEPAEPKPES